MTYCLNKINTKIRYNRIAVAGLAELRLLAAFRGGASPQSRGDRARAAAVPLASAVLSAESARFGAPLAAASVAIVAADARAFTRHRELVVAVRALGVPPEDALLPAPARPAASPHAKWPQAVCFQRRKPVDWAKACPELKR